MLVWPLQAIGWLYNISQRGEVSYKRIESLLAEANEVNTNLDSNIKAENGRLEYNINNFEFEEGKSVLRDIKFAIEKGQTLGIVGVTGAR